ncbi:MAG: imidazoleglycerol-phosphate dehydratase HisB [Clostridiales bacterium]|nr:imidazoleglycerol-phosphate dehydratase HisB [Clostridiales bacterium]
MRTSEIKRKTAETDIALSLNIDGTGVNQIDTGIGFLDHMLTLFARHGRFDLTLSCNGDTHVDAHHSVEDIGLCLGAAFAEALGDMRGIARYADIILPMDEALVLCAVDISGRSWLSFDVELSADKVGTMDTELVEEFLLAFVRRANITLHMKQLSGCNAHHIIEACFKALARTLGKAVKIDEAYKDEIPSTKGVL